MKEKIEIYLKTGNCYDFEYNSPPKINYKISLKKASKELNNLCKRKVLECHKEYKNPIYMLSGGLDSSWVVSYLKDHDIRTFCISSWNEPDIGFSKMMAKYLNSEHFIFSTIDTILTPDLLIEYVEKLPSPISLPIGIFWFLTMKKVMKELDFDVMISGDGIDTSLIEDPVEQAIRIAILRGDYDVSLAKNYLKESYLETPKNWTPSVFRNDGLPKKYIGNFKSIYDYLFTNQEIKEMGLDIFKYDLRNENPYDLFQVFLEFKLSTNRTFFKMCDRELRSPLFEEPMISYCMKLPFEMREALSIKKLIGRQICYDNGVPKEIVNRKKVDWKSKYAYRRGTFFRYNLPFDYSVKLGDLSELVCEYLDDNRKNIFNYIDFKSTRKYIHYDKMTMKLWSLLILSLWMETHRGEKWN